jgi:hypothetical protein
MHRELGSALESALGRGLSSNQVDAGREPVEKAVGPASAVQRMSCESLVQPADMSSHLNGFQAR